MKNITHKLSSLNEVQWALIGIGLFITALVIAYFTGHYKLDVISPGV